MHIYIYTYTYVYNVHIYICDIILSKDFLKYCKTLNPQTPSLGFMYRALDGFRFEGGWLGLAANGP